ncbi:MAG: hypothetical protein DMF87_21865 [Acidobacteria bacterium]|nr:MAG: hypothetical protein DMF87_21865 [Acidobacteriota bacterium]
MTLAFAILIAITVHTASAQTTGAQRAGSAPQWTKAAPFPIPEEELYGSVVNGRFYVLGGFGIGGMAPGLVFEYDPASERWNGIRRRIRGRRSRR